MELAKLRAVRSRKKPVQEPFRMDAQLVKVMQGASDYARQRSVHVVVVVPNEVHARAAMVLGSLAAGKHPFSGRTMVLPSGGRVTVSKTEDHIPAGVFEVVFEGLVDPIEAAPWQRAASRVVNL